MSLDDLHGEGWRRLLGAARKRLESNGGSLDTSVSISSPTDEERRVIIGITGSHRSAHSSRIRISLLSLEVFLCSAYGCDLPSALSFLDGQPVRNRRAERELEAAKRDSALKIINTCRHFVTSWYQAWVDQINSDGTLTRLIRRGSADLADAVTILNALPATELPLPIFAERTVGDTKALSGTSLAALVLRALELWHDLPGATAEDQRALWDAAGIVVDDLSSQVLVLNLPATGGVVAGWLTSAAAEGIPFRLTLHQLRHSIITLAAPQIFVCENPAVLRAAATTLGKRSAPLVCTEGVASVACRRLLTAAVRNGAQVRWRNDFDWPGLRMTANAIEQFGAHPWRMSTADYLAAVSANGTRLRGATAASPWDSELAMAMAANGGTLMEERLLSDLLADLTLPPPSIG